MTAGSTSFAPPARGGARPRSGAPIRRLRRAVTWLAAGLLAAFALPATAHAVAVPAPPAGWTTVFSDDFAGAAGSAPSGANWIYDTGPGSNFGTGEIETMTNSTSNVHLDGSGHLDITALQNGGSWTSGRIQTPSAQVGAPAGGKLEVTASIMQPNPGSGQGYWPAFWLLGPGQWPENGEIDIMEDVNALSDVAGTIHCGTYPGGPCNEGNGIGSGLVACPGCQGGYHTYTMVLDRTNTAAESITWYLDGNAYFSVTEGQVGTATWQQAFDHNLSIIFDLAIGGGFPNGVCGCTTPTGATSSGATMSVGYVAAYTTTGGGGGSTGTGPVTGYAGLCLDDRSSSTANYNPVQVYTCNGTAAQQWTFNPAGTTLHVLGKCLDVDAGGTANGTAVDLYDCNNTAAQVWIPRSDGSLFNPQSGRCLDDTGWSTTPGTQVQIWDCSGNANQHWTLPAA
ncbi:ricin-type beta-trefoil lectin domain protein [Kitasatospora sp. NBC_01287]|uniref:ricin-type beta-trefoil lectin domain protein n=1 Tax=Kitasatospora sp. NBC_01287 TaxID=2903573 RepID=UPI00224D1003|nr:ricin-type beta-trefoil lectin domain protein [Kitasatospora sp. NBC_01287]MCX4744485.1 ricin-type beta-trefoil lectin domain protein [Kitasatospora sp. NBC_01287]